MKRSNISFVGLIGLLASAAIVAAQAPASQPVGEYPALQKKLATLQARAAQLEQENAALKAENERLKVAQGQKAAAPAVAAAPKSTNVLRCKAEVKPGQLYTKKQVAERMEEAKKADAAIAAYLAAHEVKPAIANALYEGEIQPGMTEEEVVLITDGQEFEVFKTASRRQIKTQARRFGVFDNDLLYVTFVNGKVSSIGREAADNSDAVRGLIGH